MDPEPIATTPSSWVSALLRDPWGAPCITLALLVAIGVEVPNRSAAADPTAHHERVRAAAQTAMPYSIGDWLGRRSEPPAAAIALLHPNVLETRVYRNLTTGETATLLFVHCSDARDLSGHYPPVCYPAHGMTEDSQSPRDWEVGGLAIHGTRYRFRDTSLAGSSHTVVDNFMVLPTGGFGRDMDDVRTVASDKRLRLLGVAEVQVVTDGSMSDERRDEVFRLLVEPTVPLLRSARFEADRD